MGILYLALYLNQTNQYPLYYLHLDQESLVTQTSVRTIASQFYFVSCLIFLNPKVNNNCRAKQCV